MKATRADVLDHTPLKFGKYRNKTPDEVSDLDPGYVVWMYDTIDPKVCSKLLADSCREDTEADDEDDSGLADTYDRFNGDLE